MSVSLYVHALLSVNADAGDTEEATKEVDDLEAAFQALRELDAMSEGSWRALTIVHIEDAPVLMEGAMRVEETK